MLLNRENLKVILLRSLIKYFNLIIFLVIIVIGFISYSILFLPKYKQIQEIKQIDLSVKEDDLVKKEEHLKKFIELQQNYQSITPEDLAKIKEVLPYGPDLPGLFVQLQNIGQEYNLRLSSIAISEAKETTAKPSVQENTDIPGQIRNIYAPAAETKNIKKLSINLQYDGLSGYSAFKSFLAALENNIRLSDIDSIAFTLPASGSSNGGLINFSLTTYYLAV